MLTMNWKTGAVTLLATLLASCSGTDSFGQYPDGPKINTMTQGMGIAAEVLVFSAEFDESGGPYLVTWDFGNGATPDLVQETIESSPATVTTTANPGGGVHTATVTITDAQGRVQSDSIEYGFGQGLK
jgi:hypothetical protein